MLEYNYFISIKQIIKWLVDWCRVIIGSLGNKTLIKGKIFNFKEEFWVKKVSDLNKIVMDKAMEKKKINDMKNKNIVIMD